MRYLVVARAAPRRPSRRCRRPCCHSGQPRIQFKCPTPYQRTAASVYSERSPSHWFIVNTAVTTLGPTMRGMIDEQATATMHQAMPLTATLGVEVLECTATLVRSRLPWHESLTTSGGLLHGGTLM